MLIGTPNGTVDLRTGKLRPGRPEDYISRVTAVAPVPLDIFKPERDCPRWLAFLDEALGGDADAIRFLQQWGGYGFTGETREQKFLFVYGPGGSGKGTAVNSIADVMGDYGLNMASETITANKWNAHPEEIARLDGTGFVRASEIAQSREWDENRIKKLTGQDTISARHMYGSTFEFVPQCKFTIFGNHKPTLKNPDEAMRRRMIVLPFDHPPKMKDVHLPERLRAEWSGVLSWLIAGCLDWQKGGLVVPHLSERATAAYLEQQDVFGQFIKECCELGERYVVKSGELWDE
jgi:P4 family phage/plasmid primase-like protien